MMAMHVEAGSVGTGGGGEVVESVTPGEEKPVSKNQKKKLARLKYFAETREQWKAEKRAKAKAAKMKKRELAASAPAGSSDTGARRKAEGEDCHEQTSKKQKTETVKRVLEPITLIMDCGFDDKMNDKEIVSMSCQLTRCYAVNRSATHQVSLVVTSLNGRLLARYQSVMNSQHLNWKNVKFSDTDYEVTEENRVKGDLVYLTADSEDTVEDLIPGTSYIIGGIVDRNRYKSLCYNKAKEQGIRTAKLPIGKYIKMSSRFVLTTNQVVEIMLKYLECRDWKEAFMMVIPPRKQPKPKPKPKSKKEGEVGEDWVCESEAGEDEVGEEGSEQGGEEEVVEEEVGNMEEGKDYGTEKLESEAGANGSDTLVKRETETGNDAPGDSS